jgi:hypothetical protein
MPVIKLIGKGLNKTADPEKKYEIGQITNKQGDTVYMVVEKETGKPVCAEHWNNDLETLVVYIQSLKNPKQSKCVGCGMLEKSK